MIGEKGGGPILRLGERFEDAKFFEGARLNYAENLLRKNDGNTALVFWGEDRVKKTMTWTQLHAAVVQAEQFLRAQGVREGDRVAALMPNKPEAVVGLLAASSLGAIWSSASPDFGVQGVLDRFGQIEPKVLIACDGYYYRSKTLPIGDKVAEIIEKIPSIESALIVSYLGDPEPILKRSSKARSWHEALAAFEAKPVEFNRLPFSHPVYILYSSGTTGTPKCIVHSAGGSLIQLMKEHQLHCDLRDGDRLFYFTTLGWMMWNWLVTGLASGATLALYDGSPFHPDGNVLFDYVDEAGVNVFGTSAKWIEFGQEGRPSSARDAQAQNHADDDLDGLAALSGKLRVRLRRHQAGCRSGLHLGRHRYLLLFRARKPASPGLQWRNPRAWAWHGRRCLRRSRAAHAVGHGRACLHQTLPLNAGLFLERPRRPQISQRLFRALSRCLASWRFCRMDGTWRHYDLRPLRFDAQSGGVRIGTAELYRQVEQLEEVKESIVIGQAWDGDVRVVLFVVLERGSPWTMPCARRSNRKSATARAQGMSLRSSSRFQIFRARNPARSRRSPCAIWCMAARSRTRRPSPIRRPLTTIAVLRNCANKARLSEVLSRIRWLRQRMGEIARLCQPAAQSSVHLLWVESGNAVRK